VAQIRDHAGIASAVVDVTTVGDRGLWVRLLPSGRLDNRAVARSLDLSEAQRPRELNPLLYRPHPDNAAGMRSDYVGQGYVGDAIGQAVTTWVTALAPLTPR
jgi:hypothetical protein